MSEVPDLVMNLLQLPWTGFVAAETPLVLEARLERTEIPGGSSGVSSEVVRARERDR